MVGRLVQNEHVAALRLQHGERKLCLESAREFGDPLVHVLGDQARLSEQRSRLRLRKSPVHAPKGVKDAIGGVEPCIFLIVVGDFHIPPDRDAPVPRKEILEERTFPRAVVPQKRALLSAHQGEGGVPKEQLLVRLQVEVLGAQDALVGLFIEGKAEAGRLFGRHGLFEAFHAL